MPRKLLFLAAAALAFSAAAQAQYPDKPIRLIVPFPPGGAAELGARIYSVPLGQALGQPIVIETKPGGDGVIAADAVLKAAPDGYTLFYATNTAFNWVLATRKNPPYNPVTDFTPVSFVGYFGFFLFTHPSVPANNVSELIAYARANPGKLNYGSGGIGSAGHLAGEMFKSQAKVFMVHIPYAGGNPAQLALLSGEVDLNFDNLATASANIKGGKLKALAMTTAKRSSVMPEVPTIAESGARYGLAAFDINTWFGLFGPGGMPPAVTQRLNKAFTEALASPEIKTRLATLLAEPSPTSPEQFAAFVRNELAKYEKVVKASGARAD